ncbi:hypothetical protein KOR42_01320 [Thalassoglobus neptunius]|uniref:Uncharacterized protein n=1 Tax=Thalassoglobus neptunius TaxID=1938619 RepID=A0A5C5X1A3_9PLAN|nr:hypothetical protein KOR42_01320 [Thalassoglobus neptunius]
MIASIVETGMKPFAACLGGRVTASHSESQVERYLGIHTVTVERAPSDLVFTLSHEPTQPFA